MLEGRPSAGVRVEVERVFDEAASEGSVAEAGARYVGHAHLASGSLALRVRATARGVEVTLEAGGAPVPEGLVAVVSALIRAATKRDLTAGSPPPKRIVRWRALDDRAGSS